MSAKRNIVTLDGPAGVGKTTLAKRVAEAMGIAYMDTGAMYRTLGWKLGAQAASLDEAALAERLAAFSFSLSGSGAATVLSVNGIPVGNEIRTEEVGMLASIVAKLPAVRDALKKAQQAMGAATPLVVEGRDMGTVVFPEARCKIFLDATPQERARRRFDQLVSMGETPDLEALTEQIRQRDEQDRNRAIAPLRPADDAVIVDTTSLDIDGVFEEIMRHVRTA
jgi:cytidylate kinase